MPHGIGYPGSRRGQRQTSRPKPQTTPSKGAFPKKGRKKKK